MGSASALADLKQTLMSRDSPLRTLPRGSDKRPICRRAGILLDKVSFWRLRRPQPSHACCGRPPATGFFTLVGVPIGAGFPIACGAHSVRSAPRERHLVALPGYLAAVLAPVVLLQSLLLGGLAVTELLIRLLAGRTRPRL